MREEQTSSRETTRIHPSTFRLACWRNHTRTAELLLEGNFQEVTTSGEFRLQRILLDLPDGTLGIVYDL